MRWAKLPATGRFTRRQKKGFQHNGLDRGRVDMYGGMYVVTKY